MLKWFAAALVIVTAISGASSAFAHGKVDQKAAGPEFGVLNIQGLRLEQTFRPQNPVLSGVSLGLQRMNNGDANVTVTIRHGNSSGPIVAISTVFFPDSAPGQPFDYPSPRKMVHFDFPSDTLVVVGETYVIRVDADSAGPGWAFLDYDAYAGGNGAFLGSQMSVDFVFQTCGDQGGGGEPCKSKTIVLDKFKKFHGPSCIDFDDIVCEP